MYIIKSERIIISLKAEKKKRKSLSYKSYDYNHEEKFFSKEVI